MSNGRRCRRSESNLGPSNEAAAFHGIILIVVASVLGILLLWKGIDGPNPETNVSSNNLSTQLSQKAIRMDLERMKATLKIQMVRLQPKTQLQPRPRRCFHQPHLQKSPS